MKKYIKAMIYIAGVIAALAIEEAVKETSWFKNIVYMLQFILSHLSFFVLFGGVVYFLIHYQKLFDKYMLNQKELFTMLSFLNRKIENTKLNIENSIYYLDKGNETIINAINESINSFKLEITEINIKTGDYKTVIEFPKLKIGSEKDPRIKNPFDNEDFIKLEQEFSEILKRYEHNPNNK